MNECTRIESFADGNVGAKASLMVRRGCLPVRGSGMMTWKYQDDLCGCEQVETHNKVWICDICHKQIHDT